MELGTFSIVARCQRTGMLGVAVASAVPAVGAVCPWARADVGAIATQAFVNPYLGIEGLGHLAAGQASADVLDRLVQADPGRAQRQLAVVDRTGRAAAFTGGQTTAWAGHIVEQNFAVAGNMLAGSSVIAAMADAFADSEAAELPERLLRALEAGQDHGGDKRGKQSAALLVVGDEAYAACDLRVDEHSDAIAELRRIFEVAKTQLFPFLASLPTRDNPKGAPDAQVRTLLRKPVDARSD